MIRLKPLEQQVIVLTGASSGIGLVTARMAARRGAKLVLVARDESALQKLADEINGSGGAAIAVGADVGEEAQMRHVAQVANQHFGGFDTWINNAGVSIFGLLDQTTYEDMERLFKTNFWGCVYGSSIAVEHLKKRGGALIDVGSFFSDRATPVQSIYSASKHAMKGYTDALRMELEKEGAPISVSLVKPGRIDTPYAEHARSYQEKQPSHRGIVYPPEIAAEGILYCAEHPKRDMYIGSQAKLAKIMGDVAPRFTDKIMEMTQFRAHRSNRPSRGPDDNGLHHAGYSLAERGNHLGWMRATSLYTKASMHPRLTAFAGPASIMLLSSALLRRK